MCEIRAFNFRLLPCLYLYRPGYRVTLVERPRSQERASTREVRVRNAFLVSPEASVEYAHSLLNR